MEKEEDTIDLVALLRKVWVQRKTVLVITGSFMVLVLLVALLFPNQYTAGGTLVPQTGQQSSGGSLSGLAAMAGINLGSVTSGEVLSPNVYPNIIKNAAYQKDLIHSLYVFENVEEPVTSYEYATDPKYGKFNLLGVLKKYTIGLPGTIIGAIRGEPEDEPMRAADGVTGNEPMLHLTFKEEQVLKDLYKVFTLSLNQKEGYVQLSTSLRDPYLAAQITSKAQLLLQEYLTGFKLQKVQANREFVEDT